MKHVRFRPSAARTGRLALAAVACAALAAVAGCASSGSSSPAASSPTATSAPVGGSPGASAPAGATSNTPAVTSPSSPAAAGAAACATSSLSVKPGLAQGYAGGVYEVIDFTNTSSAPCTLLGYPGVSLVTGPPYAQIGLPAKRTAGTGKLITLAPGATANALLQIVDALNYPLASCGPAQATALKVYPPNQTAPVYLASKSTACSKSISIMNIGPVQAGSGGSA
jgi:hypothetical protein